MWPMFGWLSDASTLGLTLEAREPIGVAMERLWQHLDGDVAVQLRIACPIHLTHASCAKCGDEFIRTEPCAGGE